MVNFFMLNMNIYFRVLTIAPNRRNSMQVSAEYERYQFVYYIFVRRNVIEVRSGKTKRVQPWEQWAHGAQVIHMNVQNPEMLSHRIFVNSSKSASNNYGAMQKCANVDVEKSVN